MRTDKDLLVKGLKSFGFTAAAMFLGPFLFYEAIKNDDKPLFIPVLLLSIFFGGLAIYLGFRSINIIMEAVFGKKTKN